MASSPSPSHLADTEYSDYYFFIATAVSVALVLILTNVIAFSCCSPCSLRPAFLERILGVGTLREDGIDPKTIPVCKYRKGREIEEFESECSVCLSVFVDGEDVRELPECKHSFHAPCIDMWLYSHSNCPLCRANISVVTKLGGDGRSDEEGSRESLVTIVVL